MLRLPVSLERRLTQLFPKAADRQEFVTQTLEDAVEELETHHQQQPAGLPQAVGGTLHLFTDGGSRGNPGQAAIAYILEDPNRGEVLREHGEPIGIETNNVAEYRALIEGLKAALQFQPNRLICMMDSELVVRQVNGQYQVKMETLKPYVEEIRHLVNELPDVVFTHIPRQDNYRADALVNRALDDLKRQSRGTIPQSNIPLTRNPPPYRPPQNSLWER